MNVLRFSNLVFQNFRMIIFHDQKTLSLNFIIASLSLRHCVSTKILVGYLFLEYLFVSFDLFWWKKQPPEVFCKKGVLKRNYKFHGKAPALESLFNKVAGLLGHFEEHLWTASVANTINSQNFIILWFYNFILLLFVLNPAACNFVKNALSHRCFCFL